MNTNKKILVVDDEKNIRDSITKILQRKGYSVDTSEDAERAVSRINQTPYNLVLLDIMMPKISGMELLKTIRTQHRECNVVMITGYPSIETAVEATKDGALAYIPKPFTPEELLNAVEEALTNEENRKNFCEKGRQFCAKYAKLGCECPEDCPILEAKAKAEKRVALVKRDIKKIVKRDISKIDLDLPFDYDEVARATSRDYVNMLSRSDIPILGYKRYYEKNRNILVVDDEMVICNSVRKILSNHGYKVDYSNSVAEALIKLSSKKYALALVDLRMPGQGGIELLRQIKESHPSLKTIVITGYASIENAVESTRNGAKAFIPKPFTPNELTKAVNESLSLAA